MLRESQNGFWSFMEMTKEERLTMEEINTMNSNGDAVAIRRLLIEMY